MFQLQLPSGQASLHLQHADQELTLEFFNGDSWKLKIKDTSGLHKIDEFFDVITCKQAGALLFLWANCDEDSEFLTPAYEIIKELLQAIPPNLRPIP